MHYLDTSAKTGLNVEEAFTLLARQIVKGLKEGTIKKTR